MPINHHKFRVVPSWLLASNSECYIRWAVMSTILCWWLVMMISNHPLTQMISWCDGDHSTDCGWWSISNILWMMIRWFIFSWRHRSVSSWNSPPGMSPCQICPRITSRIRFRGRWGFINGNWPGFDSMGWWLYHIYVWPAIFWDHIS